MQQNRRLEQLVITKIAASAQKIQIVDGVTLKVFAKLEML